MCCHLRTVYFVPVLANRTRGVAAQPKQLLQRAVPVADAERLVALHAKSPRRVVAERICSCDTGFDNGGE